VSGGMRRGAEQSGRREDLARRAEAALERVVLDERGLDPVERIAAGEALDGRDAAPVAGGGEREAGVDRRFVEENGAGAALAAAADELRAGELQPFAQRDEQRLMVGRGDVVRGSVDDEAHATILASTRLDRRITRGTNA